MHWIYSTRQNRIVIATLKQTADDGILKRRSPIASQMSFTWLKTLSTEALDAWTNATR